MEIFINNITLYTLISTLVTTEDLNTLSIEFKIFAAFEQKAPIVTRQYNFTLFLFHVGSLSDFLLTNIVIFSYLLTFYNIEL